MGVRIIFPCLNKLDKDLKCEDMNCIFNSQGKCPRCEYFDDEEEDHCYVPEEKKGDSFKCLIHLTK